MAAVSKVLTLFEESRDISEADIIDVAPPRLTNRCVS